MSINIMQAKRAVEVLKASLIELAFIEVHLENEDMQYDSVTDDALDSFTALLLRAKHLKEDHLKTIVFIRNNKELSDVFDKLFPRA